MADMTMGEKTRFSIMGVAVLGLAGSVVLSMRKTPPAPTAHSQPVTVSPVPEARTTPPTYALLAASPATPHMSAVGSTVTVNKPQWVVVYLDGVLPTITPPPMLNVSFGVASPASSMAFDWATMPNEIGAYNPPYEGPRWSHAIVPARAGGNCFNRDGTATAQPDNVTFTLQPGFRWTVRAAFCPAISSTRFETLTLDLSCPADLNRDLGVTIEDQQIFLNAFEAGTPAADLDDGTGSGIPDGGVDINDLLYFLSHYEAGC